ncbi:hypothetical protein C241_02744 [Bradyrhizobium lupini HPC(L)]|uniref:Uncharacterized protein n=1 Tax=Bradyrhizobium lupini HPC(L) TaxID=1229491 RepID=A0ABP2RYB8_RHILU|nr:hypothetical protein C241_02744 [Bradyrhizobium lupini HPC(L)]
MTLPMTVTASRTIPPSWFFREGPRGASTVMLGIGFFGRDKLNTDAAVMAQHNGALIMNGERADIHQNALAINLHGAAVLALGWSVIVCRLGSGGNIMLKEGRSSSSDQRAWQLLSRIAPRRFSSSCGMRHFNVLLGCQFAVNCVCH